MIYLTFSDLYQSPRYARDLLTVEELLDIIHFMSLQERELISSTFDKMRLNFSNRRSSQAIHNEFQSDVENTSEPDSPTPDGRRQSDMNNGDSYCLKRPPSPRQIAFQSQTNSTISELFTNIQQNPKQQSNNLQQSILQTNNDKQPKDVRSHEDCTSYLNLKASVSQIFWGSTKLHKSISKNFTLKNMSNLPQIVHMNVEGPGYQIVGNNSETFESQERRVITITFCPTMIGAAYGKLHIVSSNVETNNRNEFIVVDLYGLGGNAKIEVTGMEIAPPGKSTLYIWNVQEMMQTKMAKQFFTISNEGDLPGVAIITITAAQPGLNVYPRKLFLYPKSQQQICVEYHPKQSSLYKFELFKRSFTIAKLEILYGDEPNRQRIVRLLDKRKEQTNANDYEEMEKRFCEDLPDNPITVHFDDFDESTVSLLFGIHLI